VGCPFRGVGADYPGRFVVESLIHAAPATEGFGCREDLSGVAFLASGQEPFWRLRVTGDGILFSTPEIPETAFTLVTPTPITGGWVYEAGAIELEPPSIRIRLARGRCTDSMVGSLYTWTASVDGRPAPAPRH